MKSVVLIITSLVFLAACHKSKHEDPGPFYINYTINDTSHQINQGTEYLFYQGTALSLSAGLEHGFITSTRFFPAFPHDENISHN